MADIIQTDLQTVDFTDAGNTTLTADGQDVAMLDDTMAMPLLAMNTMSGGANGTNGGSTRNANDSSDPLQALIQMLQSLLQQLQGNSANYGGRNNANNNTNAGGMNSGGRNDNHTNTGGRNDNHNNINRGGRNDRANGNNQNTNQAPLPGGYSRVAATNPEVKSAASFAANKLGGTVKSVSNASQQVVAGMNYNMDITLTNGKTYNATVYKALDGSYSLSDSKRIA